MAFEILGTAVSVVLGATALGFTLGYALRRALRRKRNG